MSRLLAGVVLVALPYGSAHAFAGGNTAGDTAYERGDYTTAFREFLLLAQEGNHMAQYNLGVMYIQGQGVPRDFAKAMKWFRKSADQGSMLAQNNLGFMYYSGHGVPISYLEAMKWYRKAAEQGFVLAQIRLGSMYGDGKGVPVNHAEAVKWLRRSAEQGFTNAQIWLGVEYVAGRGTPKDYVQAYKWVWLAAKRYREGKERDDMYLSKSTKKAYAVYKHPNKDLVTAIKLLSEIEQQMTPEQITTAQTLAREWKPKESPNRCSATTTRGECVEFLGVGSR